jgi:fluoride exporter
VSEQPVRVEPSKPAVTVPIAVAIALGGAVGGYVRVGASLLPGTGSSGSWPWITFAVNIAGAFVLALTVSLLHVRGRLTSRWRLLVGVGFCGALTTFSTLQLELFRMLRAGNDGLAAGYLAASVAAGLAAVAAGLMLGRRVPAS